MKFRVRQPAICWMILASIEAHICEDDLDPVHYGKSLARGKFPCGVEPGYRMLAEVHLSEGRPSL